nr:proline-rich protein 36-like [Equus asinus]
MPPEARPQPGTAPASRPGLSPKVIACLPRLWLQDPRLPLSTPHPSTARTSHHPQPWVSRGEAAGRVAPSLGGEGAECALQVQGGGQDSPAPEVNVNAVPAMVLGVAESHASGRVSRHGLRDPYHVDTHAVLARLLPGDKRWLSWAWVSSPGDRGHQGATPSPSPPGGLSVPWGQERNRLPGPLSPLEKLLCSCQLPLDKPWAGPSLPSAGTCLSPGPPAPGWAAGALTTWRPVHLEVQAAARLSTPPHCSPRGLLRDPLRTQTQRHQSRSCLTPLTRPKVSNEPAADPFSLVPPTHPPTLPPPARPNTPSLHYPAARPQGAELCCLCAPTSSARTSPQNQSDLPRISGELPPPPGSPSPAGLEGPRCAPMALVRVLSTWGCHCLLSCCPPNAAAAPAPGTASAEAPPG